MRHWSTLVIKSEYRPTVFSNTTNSRESPKIGWQKLLLQHPLTHTHSSHHKTVLDSILDSQ